MLKKILIVIFILLALSIAYYLISPLFITVHVDDSLPVMMDENNEAQVEIVQTTGNPVIGSAGHPASGTVRLIETGGETILRYEDFKTINGPDLYLYLANDLDAKDFVDLGKIRGTEGNINYTIPSNINVEDYKYVMTWCKRFGVLFNHAEI